MPITKSAEKALRSSKRKRIFNLARKEALKTTEKSLRKLLPGKDLSATQASLSAAYKAIDKAAKRGVIKKNTAARKKSRLAALVAKSGKKA